MLHPSLFQTTLFVTVSIALTIAYRSYTEISSTTEPTSMPTAKTLKAAMTTLSHAKIVPRRSAERGDANHGWLLSKHSFSFAEYYDPRFQSFGSIRVLNEDRVAPGSGFPTHPHRDAEIFSYIISGELTHRDSMIKKGVESANKDQFYRMKRGDVQFTTGGTGIAHSEQNEHPSDWVHFLQIWATPWKRGLQPIYHTSTFSEVDKRKGFVNIITPLKAGPKATLEEEKAAAPVLEGTIPVHADLIFSAGIIPQGETFKYTIGGDNIATSKKDRKIYVHLPMTKGGKSKIRLAGRTDSSAILEEGDAAFVSNVNAGDVLTVESLGEAEAEVVVLDSN
jgi:quercetin 2,3-dioxygenase